MRRWAHRTGQRRAPASLCTDPPVPPKSLPSALLKAPFAAALARAGAVPEIVARLGRSRGLMLLALGILGGVAAGLVVYVIGWAMHELHVELFDLPRGANLSAQTALGSPWMALIPAAGGILMGVSIVLARRFRTRPPVDPIEANAIHGGRLSFRESLIVTVQTVISSSFGASVGLEAGYTQMSAALTSLAALRLQLRRNEVRMLVGCGAAGAIAAAFDAPFTGAFYAFELIIGVYSISLLAPVVAASLAAMFTARWLGAVQTPILLYNVQPLSGADVIPFLILGVVGGGVAIAVMVSVALVERGISALRIAHPMRPFVGGLVVGALALLTPQVLSTGHGALHLQLVDQFGLWVVFAVFVLKFVASTVSLGSGFRGGLFFSSLFLGALLGKLYAGLLGISGVTPHIDGTLAAVVGMASVASGVVGGPLTMSFLVLETTGDLGISAAVLVAAAMSAFLVRETFGYSFSTWRLHLRGETIRSAHDVGRLRSLNVANMMRPDVRTVPERTTIEEFRKTFPLGSTQRVIALDRAGQYAGIILVADAYQPQAAAEDGKPRTVQSLAKYKDRFLLPGLNVADAAAVFDKAKSEELAVLDSLGSRKVVGLLTESHLLRRYAEELDKGLKDLTG